MEDQRFQSLMKDPRCRDIPKNVRKVKVDKRFQKMLKHKQFKGNVRIDERGRKVNFSTSEKLKKLYHLKNSSEEEDSSSENSGDERKDFKEKNSSLLRIKKNEMTKHIKPVNASPNKGNILQDRKPKHLQEDKTKAPKLVSDLPDNVAISEDDSSEEEDESIESEDESKNFPSDSGTVQKKKEKLQKNKTIENLKPKKIDSSPDENLSGMY